MVRMFQCATLRLAFYKCCAKSMECASLFVKSGINYPQTIIMMKLMNLTVLYTATMMRGKQLLRKSKKKFVHNVLLYESDVSLRDIINIFFSSSALECESSE